MNRAVPTYHVLRHCQTPVIAIIGAGPGLGLATAKIFGAYGFNAALLSRSPSRLEPVVAELAAHGVEADAFYADVFDCSSIVSGLSAVKRRFGQIDVLEFSPVDRVLLPAPAAELPDDDAPALTCFHLHSAIAAVKQVLPAMIARGSGTILFTTGTSSVHPHHGSNLLAVFAHALHAAVAPNGVQVVHVGVGAFIGRRPGATSEEVAPLYWELHTQREQVEKVFMTETAM